MVEHNPTTEGRTKWNIRVYCKVVISSVRHAFYDSFYISMLNMENTVKEEQIESIVSIYQASALMV